MKNIFFVIFLLLVVSCGNRPKTNNTEISPSSEGLVIAQEKLDSNLVNGILELILTNDHLEFPDIPLSNSFIMVNFKVNPEKQVYFPDSIVDICYNVIRDYNAPIVDYYKGMLNIEGYNVAIFDENSFGEKYYNRDSLQQISLENFRYYPMRIISTLKYYVDNDKLKLWNP